MASWTDALPVLDVKLPSLARNISACLSRRALPSDWSLSEVQLAYCYIMEKGGDLIPIWEKIRKGSTPPQLENEREGADASEWTRGWQYYTCSIIEHFVLNNMIKPFCDPSRLALLHS